MLFWIIWAVVVLAVACVFAASLRSYLIHRGAGDRWHFRRRWGDASIVALEAQFYLAPRIAEAELREMLAGKKGRVNEQEFLDAVSFSRALNELQSTGGRTR
jgi:hypothetical protein